MNGQYIRIGDSYFWDWQGHNFEGVTGTKPFGYWADVDDFDVKHGPYFYNDTVNIDVPELASIFVSRPVSR